MYMLTFYWLDRRGGPRLLTARLHNAANPRLPPHPRPTLVQPLARIGANWTPQGLVPKIITSGKGW